MSPEERYKKWRHEYAEAMQRRVNVTDKKDAFPVPVAFPEQAKGTPQKLTGGSSDYYVLPITHPTRGGTAYTAECNDIIEALGMDFAEGNAFKALWRRAAARKGNGKPGTSSLYDAEKVEFFGRRLVIQEKQRAST